LDNETGGLLPKESDITQIAGQVKIDGVVKEEFNFLMRPDSLDRVKAEAVAVSKKTIEQVMAHPLSQREGYEALSKVLGKHCDKFNSSDKFFLCGQNPVFDDGFLRELWQKQGDKYYGSYFWHYRLDLISAMMLVRTRGYFSNMPNMKLGSICAALGVPLGDGAHDALADIRATAACFDKLAEMIPLAPVLPPAAIAAPKE
jgi:DNA polymerase III alpha subunit (gram-positive type)